MSLDFSSLETLRSHHPAWRLLNSPHAPLVASFLHKAFIAPNVRVIAAVDLAEALEDQLFALRQQLGDEVFPRPALDYLNDKPHRDELKRLRPEERALYDDLRNNRLREKLRLEQEHIGYRWLSGRLAGLQSQSPSRAVSFRSDHR